MINRRLARRAADPAPAAGRTGTAGRGPTPPARAVAAARAAGRRGPAPLLRPAPEPDPGGAEGPDDRRGLLLTG